MKFGQNFGETFGKTFAKFWESFVAPTSPPKTKRKKLYIIYCKINFLPKF